MIPTSLIEEQLVVLSRLKTLHGYARGNEDGHALHTYTSGSAPRYTPPASHMTAHHAQRWMQTSVIMLALHAGFDGIQIQPLEVLSQVAEEFIVQLAKKMMQHHTTSCSLWRTSYETKQNELPPLIEHVREYKIPRTIATNKVSTWDELNGSDLNIDVLICLVKRSSHSVAMGSNRSLPSTWFGLYRSDTIRYSHRSLWGSSGVNGTQGTKESQGT